MKSFFNLKFLFRRLNVKSWYKDLSILNPAISRIFKSSINFLWLQKSKFFMRYKLVTMLTHISSLYKNLNVISLLYLFTLYLLNQKFKYICVRTNHQTRIHLQMNFKFWVTFFFTFSTCYYMLLVAVVMNELTDFAATEIWFNLNLQKTIFQEPIICKWVVVVEIVHHPISAKNKAVPLCFEQEYIECLFN